MKPALIKSLLICTVVMFSARLTAGEIIGLQTSRDAKQYIYIIKNPNATANVILFPGGAGKLKLHKGTSKLTKVNNFLVRSRRLFASHNFNVIVIDAPTDKQRNHGMLYGFRTSQQHIHDITLVIRFLQKTSKLPVWLVGTSRGTVSVAWAAIKSRRLIEGIVLTSSLTRPNAKDRSLAELPLHKITVPVLVIANSNDTCHVTPPSDTRYIARKFRRSSKVVSRLFSSHQSADVKPCKGLSAHGYAGIEPKVVSFISSFIKQASNRSRY